MKIETYEVEEIKASEASTMAADSEAIELCQRLGLEGQLKLTNKETGTRFPYRRISALEERVYTTLFPAKTKLEDYDAEPIPLRVLQVAAHVREINLKEMSYLEVWHPTDSKKDPVLVARESSYWGPYYILARWGDALQPLDVLAASAKKVWLATMRNKLAQIKQRIDVDISSLEVTADEVFLTGNDKAFNYQAH